MPHSRLPTEQTTVTSRVSSHNVKLISLADIAASWPALSNGLTWFAVSASLFASTSISGIGWNFASNFIAAICFSVTMCLCMMSARIPRLNRQASSSYTAIYCVQLLASMFVYAVSVRLFSLFAVSAEVVAITSASALSWTAASAWFLTAFFSKLPWKMRKGLPIMNGTLFVFTGIFWFSILLMQGVLNPDWGVTSTLGIVAILLMVTTLWYWFWVASTLMQRFDGFSTFLIVSGTCLAGLSLGWLIKA